MSGAGLFVAAPLMAMVAAAIWVCDGSPVLFRQSRPGYKGEPFVLLKFRTMREARDAGGRLPADEERLTALGRLLRQLSLDELPQLWNVLRGEMSLVGPRPLLMAVPGALFGGGDAAARGEAGDYGLGADSREKRDELAGEIRAGCVVRGALEFGAGCADFGADGVDGFWRARAWTARRGHVSDAGVFGKRAEQAPRGSGQVVSGRQDFCLWQPGGHGKVVADTARCRRGEERTCGICG